MSSLRSSAKFRAPKTRAVQLNAGRPSARRKRETPGGCQLWWSAIRTRRTCHTIFKWRIRTSLPLDDLDLRQLRLLDWPLLGFVAYTPLPMRSVMTIFLAALVSCTWALGVSAAPPKAEAPAHASRLWTPPVVLDPMAVLAGNTSTVETQGESEAETPTIRTLCEPVDSRRPYPTREERSQVQSVIRATCKEMGVSPSSCVYFEKIVSLRESSYRSWVRHKHAGDRAAAVRSYMAMAHAYGWIVNWDRAAQQRDDLGAMTFERYQEEQNPYYPEVERWLTGGLGLGGLNVGYHLAKFDKKAPPEILCDPVINVMVQIYLARGAVNRYGASNWIEVQAIYGGRVTYDRKGRTVPATCKAYQRRDEPCPDGVRKMEMGIRKRCSAQGLDCLSRPELGDRYPQRQTSAEEKYRAAEKVRGAPLPPFDAPSRPGS